MPMNDYYTGVRPVVMKWERDVDCGKSVRSWCDGPIELVLVPASAPRLV